MSICRSAFFASHFTPPRRLVITIRLSHSLPLFTLPKRGHVVAMIIHVFLARPPPIAASHASPFRYATFCLLRLMLCRDVAAAVATILHAGYASY